MTGIPAGIGARALGWIGSLWTSHWILICVIVGLVGYHEYAILSAVSAAEKAKDIEWNKTIAAANQAAKDDHELQQSKIDSLAGAAQPDIAKRMDAINAKLIVLTAAAKKPAAVFKPDCIMPQSEVDAYNAIR